jgi:hypothetical protein
MGSTGTIQKTLSFLKQSGVGEAVQQDLLMNYSTGTWKIKSKIAE